MPITTAKTSAYFWMLSRKLFEAEKHLLPVHFLCYPCQLVTHGSVVLRWSEKQRAFTRRLPWPQQEWLKNVAKEESSQRFYLCVWFGTGQVNTAGSEALPSSPRKNRAISFVAFKETKQNTHTQKRLIYCVRYRNKDTYQRFHWYYALQQAAFPLHNRFINRRRLTRPCVSHIFLYISCFHWIQETHNCLL